MKRFLHAGEGYVLFKRPSLEAIPCSSDTTLTDNKRYINKTTSKAYGLLVRPWFRQAAGILLVALVCLSARTGRAISRLLTGISSSFSRSVVEGLSKPTRTTVEADSKDCRSGVEGLSNNSRTSVEQISKKQALCNFSVLRMSCIYLGLFFMCLQAVIAKEPLVPETDRAVLVAHLISFDTDNNVIPYQLSGRSNLRPLKIGQKIPRNMLMGDPVFNRDTDQITTRDFKKRAVIIDIWATWCGSCISQFPKMDSLQNLYAAHLDVYLLNNLYRDNEDNIVGFLEEFKERYPDFDLPLMVGNLDTRALFPGSVLPHYVWIDANGRVKAITGSEEVTGSNIERLIAGLSIDAKEKKR